jgi:hypothetical protein
MNIREIYLENMVLKAVNGAEPAEAQQMHLTEIRLLTSGPQRLSSMEPGKRPLN